MIGKENKMKKFMCLMTAALLLLSLAACGGSAPAATEPPVPETPSPIPSAEPSEAPAGETMGQALLADFKEILSAEPDIGAEELANRLLENPVIEFSGASMPVEAGLMAGFGDAEISGAPCSALSSAPSPLWAMCFFWRRMRTRTPLSKP